MGPNKQVFPMHLLQRQQLMLLVAVPTRLSSPTHPLFAAPTHPLLRQELRPQRGLLLTLRLAASQPCLPLAAPTLSSAAHDFVQ